MKSKRVNSDVQQTSSPGGDIKQGTNYNNAPKKILDDMLHRYKELRDCSQTVMDAYELMVRVFDDGGTLFVAGNGGSAADSEHMAGELLKSFLHKRPLRTDEADYLVDRFGLEGETLIKRIDAGLPVVPLPSLVSLTTAVVNDTDGRYILKSRLNYTQVLERQPIQL